MIQIDESTIVEEYSWLARNLTNLPRRYAVQQTPTEQVPVDPEYTVSR